MILTHPLFAFFLITWASSMCDSWQDCALEKHQYQLSAIELKTNGKQVLENTSDSVFFVILVCGSVGFVY